MRLDQLDSYLFNFSLYFVKTVVFKSEKPARLFDCEINISVAK